MKPTFLKHNKEIFTTMVQVNIPQRIEELIDLSLPEGAEAFGMQFEQMEKEYRIPKRANGSLLMQRISRCM